MFYDLRIVPDVGRGRYDSCRTYGMYNDIFVSRFRYTILLRKNFGFKSHDYDVCKER